MSHLSGQRSSDQHEELYGRNGFSVVGSSKLKLIRACDGDRSLALLHNTARKPEPEGKTCIDLNGSGLRLDSVPGPPASVSLCTVGPVHVLDQCCLT